MKDPKPKETVYYTVEEAAEISGYQPATLYRYAQEEFAPGWGPPCPTIMVPRTARKGPRMKRLFPKKAFMDWISLRDAKQIERAKKRRRTKTEKLREQLAKLQAKHDKAIAQLQAAQGAAAPRGPSKREQELERMAKRLQAQLAAATAPKGPSRREQELERMAKRLQAQLAAATAPKGPSRREQELEKMAERLNAQVKAFQADRIILVEARKIATDERNQAQRDAQQRSQQMRELKAHHEQALKEARGQLAQARRDLHRYATIDIVAAQEMQSVSNWHRTLPATRDSWAAGGYYLDYGQVLAEALRHAGTNEDGPLNPWPIPIWVACRIPYLNREDIVEIWWALRRDGDRQRTIHGIKKETLVQQTMQRLGWHWTPNKGLRHPLGW